MKPTTGTTDLLLELDAMEREAMASLTKMDHGPGRRVIAEHFKAAGTLRAVDRLRGWLAK